MIGDAKLPLESVCHIEYGTRVVRKRDGGQGYPVYGGGGATFEMSTFNREDRLVVARFGISEECTRFVAGKFFLNDSGLTVSPRNGSLLQRYLDYYLLSLNDTIFALGKGTAQRNLDVVAFRSLPIFVPSIAKQQRLVELLDEAFAGLVKTKANVERNRDNARALFESHLESVFCQKDKGWVERRLGDIVTRLTNGYVGPIRDIYVAAGVPYLLARHVKNNVLAFDRKTFISEEFNKKNKKSMLKAGDVLLVQSGHIGHSAVVTQEHEGHNCHAMIVITPIASVVTGDFLSLYFNSPAMRQRFDQIRSGSTVPHLTCGEVKEMCLALPSVTAQRRLVEHVDKVQAQTRYLEELSRKKLEALATLKKSLLQRAFIGAA